MRTAGDPILIVGAGFGGLCMAIRLKQRGIHDFMILEQADEVGGTWRDNEYPGAACDIESHLYSFSFAPNPQWSRAFATQKEILAYLLACADKFDVRRHIRFRTRAAGARFDESSGLWTVTTGAGDTLSARVVVLACGGLSRPAYPDIAGLSTFEGKMFHSARWDKDFPLAGKTVAVIGTGASAIQIVPAIAAQVARLFVYQRTAPWIMPKPDRPIRPFEQTVFRRMPLAQKLARWAIYCQHEALALGFVVDRRIMKLGERLSRSYLERSIADPGLRAKLTPHYAMGCKRILPTNDYYPALLRENVEVVTEAIHEVRRASVVTKDGAERSADCIVVATGFRAAEQVAPFDIVGRDGRALQDVWKEGAEAYLGTSVAGYPHLFFIIGPNTGLGHNSMVFMIESQVTYIRSCIEAMRARALKFVDVRAGAQSRYNQRIQARMRKTVWSTGCRSWYQTASGKNTTLWPGFTFEFRLRARHFDGGEYGMAGKETGARNGTAGSDGAGGGGDAEPLPARAG